MLGLAMVASAAGECANACNGHGKCTSYDMCICHRNWQANDCSERVCQFGLAHVDTPKGDLDNDGSVQDLSSSDPVVVENNFVYPYGTTEMFPRMVDSDLKEISDSAHYYMECSNKGTCDRKKGTCKCFAGYDGAACQRASCPGGTVKPCSGHGVCKNIQQLAAADNENIYELWDRHTTMGCECDPGYYGADCSQRTCKTGVDPLYMDDSTTIKYATWNFATLTWDTSLNSGNVFTNGMADDGEGTFAIRWFDSNGEDWLTEPITAGSTCATVVAALESLPNDVIPDNSLYCTMVSSTTGTQHMSGEDKYAYDGSPSDGSEENDAMKIRPYHYNLSFWETAASQFDTFTDVKPTSALSGLPFSYQKKDTKTEQPLVAGYIYKIKFLGNPGALREPEIEIYLDGDRPTLAAVEYRSTGGKTNTYSTAKVLAKVWTDGMQGENKDYFADHCDGVRVVPGRFDNTEAIVNTLPSRTIHYLKVLDVDKQSNSDNEIVLLKTCLGGADDFSDARNYNNNVEAYDWDYGTPEYPHIIKLVRSVTTVTDGGHYAIVIYRSGSNYSPGSYIPVGSGETTGFFEVLNPWFPTYLNSVEDTAPAEYDVYTTKGTLALTSDASSAFFGYASKEIYLYNHEDKSSRRPDEKFYSGGISCEMKNSEKYRSKVSHDWWDHVNFEADYITYCLDKNDIIIPLAIGDDSDANEQKKVNYNPPYINMYTAQKLWTKPPQALDADVFNDKPARQILEHYDSQMFRHTIKTDMSLNWATTPAGGAEFKIYKFFPHDDSTYEYVAECSNRGLCNDEGICECFPGYGNDNCDEQNSLAV